MSLLSGATCSYDGTLCGPQADTPSPLAIAVSLGRLCRWVGSGPFFYPVLLHSLAVAELLPDRARFYGLVHDATEASMCDVPRPFKCACFKEAEAVYADRLLESFGVPLPSDEIKAAVKAADDAMLSAEVWAGIGHPSLQVHFPDRNLAAETVCKEIGNRYSVYDCVYPTGRAVRKFLHLFDKYKEML